MPNEQANGAYDSPASVCKFQSYEAGNRDGEIELPDDCLQIGQAASKWIDRNDVPVTRGGQRSRPPSGRRLGQLAVVFTKVVSGIRQGSLLGQV